MQVGNGRLFAAITRLQFAGGCKALGEWEWDGGGGGASAEEVLASGFTVQRERQGGFKSRASAIVTQSFHFTNKRLTAYSDSLVLILSARAALPSTRQPHNVIPASRMQRPEGQGLCAPTKICATLTDIKKNEKKGGGMGTGGWGGDKDAVVLVFFQQEPF